MFIGQDGLDIEVMMWYLVLTEDDLRICLIDTRVIYDIEGFGSRI